MGVCMGKDSSLLPTTLEPDGRFTSQFEPTTMQQQQNHQQNGTIPNNNARNSASTMNGGPTTNGIVRFSEPRVPVIFVLGGPGSGKITHCDRVVQERQGLAHVNMTDLVQQHIIGNGLDDFTQMPATNLIQVLQMEMKMTVNATGYLISGYPRSMRDVVEYNEKLHRVDAVILLNWHIKILEKQIEFGSQLGETVLQLARMELRNYIKNVLAVAEYYDQLKKLVVVDGERQPTEVYNDFLKAIDSVIKPPSTTTQVTDKPPATIQPQPQSIKQQNQQLIVPIQHSIVTTKLVLWIIGGPGSNKSILSSNPRYPWKHLSIGHVLRTLNNNNVYGLTQDQVQSIKNTLRRGELISNELVLRIVFEFLRGNSFVVLDGFPRNSEQLVSFERETQLKPPCILIDCSEVELGRSLGQRNSKNTTRTDNNSDAIKARLLSYRLITLPTLKQLDDQQRLHIVDGDGDPSKVVTEFTTVFNDVLNSLEYSSGGIGGIVESTGTIIDKERKPSTDTIKAMYNELLGE